MKWFSVTLVKTVLQRILARLSHQAVAEFFVDSWMHITEEQAGLNEGRIGSGLFSWIWCLENSSQELQPFVSHEVVFRGSYRQVRNVCPSHLFSALGSQFMPCAQQLLAMGCSMPGAWGAAGQTGQLSLSQQHVFLLQPRQLRGGGNWAVLIPAPWKEGRLPPDWLWSLAGRSCCLITSAEKSLGTVGIHSHRKNWGAACYVLHQLK